ncbi:MAG: hypothetical protein BA867_02765 [Desulfobacterales bacterium S5133MH16]|nr:MAG: hypothetical protein BA867_02765 [Desulfobacterales bacterium S5133MH16]
MFEKFFECPSRIKTLREGPGGPLLEGFTTELYQVGYAEGTGRKHIRAAEHLIHWTETIKGSSLLLTFVAISGKENPCLGH